MYYSIVPIEVIECKQSERDIKMMKYRGHQVEYHQDEVGIKYITRLHATNLSAYLDDGLSPGSVISQ